MSVPMAPPDMGARRRPRADHVAGLIGFWAAVLLLRGPFWFVVAVARASRVAARRPATVDQAAAAVAAVRHSARHYPGRAACLELSLAAVFASATRGRRVDWCLGARFGPAEIHAWIEAGQGPVGEAPDVGRAYTVALRV